MSTLAILTPSYRPDLSSFLDLHDSVCKFTSDDVLHHVVVPDKDVALFEQHAHAKLKVYSIRSFVPASFLSTYVTSKRLRTQRWSARVAKVEAINLRHPWPPVRGWILQQMAKLAVAPKLDADVVLVIDSDVALIQHTPANSLVQNGVVRFYKSPDAITGDMTQHVAWHRAARRLLGLSDETGLPLTDYVGPFVAWDPRISAALLTRIADVTGGDWRTAVCSELKFSEFILYGVFVDLLSAPTSRTWSSSRSLCHTYWETSPLADAQAARSLISTMQGDELALHIHSKSGTASDIRRLATLEAIQQLNGRAGCEN